MPKTACVLRWGAWGDLIQASILFPVLKEKGYHLTVNTTKRGFEVIKNDPHVDAFVMYEDDTVEHKDLEEYWDNLAKGFDKFINLSGSVEGSLLKAEGKPDFNLHKLERHMLCNKNYFDNQFVKAGYPEITGRNPKMHYSPLEHQLARKERKKHKGNFLILWAQSGSSMHKSYPYTEYVLMKLLDRYNDVSVIFTGDTVCQILFDRSIFQKMGVSKRVHNKCGHWPIRKSLIMTEHCDLVVGPETGVLNAAGGLDVPKVLFLSHSTHENLSKHWKNVTPLWSEVHCYPCHQLHYTLNSCSLDAELGTPICMSKLNATWVYDAIEKNYLRWKDEKSEKVSN